MTTVSTTEHARSTAVRYERLAVAIDASPQSEDALALAAALVPGADLLMLSVEPELERMLAPAHIRAIRRETETMLARRRHRYAPQARTAITAGFSPAHELQRLVTHHHRQLLVVGSGRQGGPGEAWLGHETRPLMDHLGIPIAVAAQGIAAGAPLRVRRIGVGFDGGPESRAALQVAATIARATRGTLIVRGVVDDRLPALAWPGSWAERTHTLWSEAAGRDAAALESRLEAATADLDISTETSVRRGAPAEVLRELSADLDLLAIGSRRWGTAARLLLGGTGEALVHGTRCSLLIAPRPGDTAH